MSPLPRPHLAAPCPELIPGHILLTIGTMGMISAFLLTILQPASQFPWDMAGGTGTITDPYRIETCEQLQNMSKAPTRHYILSQDIDCSLSATWDGGSGFFPIGYYGYGFSGTLDGHGYAIHHLSINRPSSDYLGLFGKLDAGAHVHDLLLETTLHGREYVGGIAGWMVGGTVERVSVKGSISAKRGAGGIAGVNQSIIRDARTDVSVSGDNWIGGIVGWNYASSWIEHVEVSGTVQGKGTTGGVAGISHGALIEHCLVSADIEVNGQAGKAVGKLQNHGTLAGVVNDCLVEDTAHGAADTRWRAGE